MNRKQIRVAVVAALASINAFSSSQATVRNVPRVWIEGPPRAAESGQTFSGTLVFQTVRPMRLESPRLAGTGWRILRFEASGDIELDANAPRRVSFTAVPSDPEAPLSIEAQLDGKRFEQRFDLSPQQLARIIGRATGMTATPSIDPRSWPKHQSLGAAEIQLREPDLAAPASPPGIASRTIRVHGRIVVTRPDGVTEGLDASTIKLQDLRQGSLPDLAQQLTDPQGYYDITFTWNSSIDPSFSVRCFAENSVVRGVDPAFNTVVSEVICVVNNFTGTDVALQTRHVDDIADLCAGVGTVSRNYRWYSAQGHILPDCVIQRHIENLYDGNIIYCTPPSLFDAGVVTHEYAHHWMWNLTTPPSFTYCNDNCDAAPEIGDCGHCLWCPESEQVAWVDGFADWMEDVLPRTFKAAYGTAAMVAFDFEFFPSDGCSDPETQAPIVEGYLAAALRDLADPEADRRAGFRDRTAFGPGALLSAIRSLDPVAGSSDFLLRLLTANPTLKRQIWETCKLNYFEIDQDAPALVTNLICTDHSINVPSPDATFSFSWTEANDDASGVDAYSILLAPGPFPPSAVVPNLAGVTTYFTTAMAPGNYWFNIRARDRSGKWGDYESIGPFVVQAPQNMDLRPYAWPGWSAPLVPRPAPDATVTSVPAPTSLQGNANSTYFNLGWVNAGTQATGTAYTLWAIVDGIPANFLINLPNLNPDEGDYIINAALNPRDLRGGRHTLTVEADPTGVLGEPNELDNVAGKQWVWSPMELPNTVVRRRWMPSFNGGWWQVNSGLTLPNCDGFRFTASAAWNAVSLRSKTPGTDYDLELFEPSNGPTDGFEVAEERSSLLDDLDVVFAQAGTGTWDVGVKNPAAWTDSFLVQLVTSEHLAVGDSIQSTFGPWESLKIFDFTTTTDWEAELQIDGVIPAGSSLHMSWFDSGQTTRGTPYGIGQANTDAYGRANLLSLLPANGSSCLVVWRDPDQGSMTLPITVRLYGSRPDLLVAAPYGWCADEQIPLVPSPANDGTDQIVAFPLALPGDIASTYLNISTHNRASAAISNVDVRVMLDGVEVASFLDSYAPHTYAFHHVANPIVVPSGRHTLALAIDPLNLLHERDRHDNTYARSWIWTPADLYIGSTTLRTAPPIPYAGAESGGYPFLFPNVDGIGIPTPPIQIAASEAPTKATRSAPPTATSPVMWEALAISPGPNSDYDLRLLQKAVAPWIGFETPLVTSTWGQGETEYVLVNFWQTSYQPFDAGVMNTSGNEPYRAEMVAATPLANPIGTHGPFTLGVNHILALHEVFLGAGSWVIRLRNTSGSVNWGMSMHDAQQAYQSRDTSVPNRIAYLAPQGLDETLHITLPEFDYYCLAVWKAGSEDVARSGSYRIEIQPDTHPTDPGTDLAATSLDLHAAPNPSHGTTQISFGLQREGPVTMQVFDVRGGLVRQVRRDRLAAGRRTIDWDGRDATGKQVSAGVYVIRLDAGGRKSTTRVVMVQGGRK